MPAPVTIPAIPNTWTPYTAPVDAYAELGSASQPVGLGSARILFSSISSVQSNVLAYGAKSDSGTTDNTSAFQSAVNATPSGGVLFIPSQTGYYKVANQVTITTPMTVVLRGQVRTSDKTKLAFLVTSSDVTFIFEGGSFQGPGDFNQNSAAGSNYGGFVEFRGTSALAPIKNLRVVNPRLIDCPWSGIYFRYCAGFQVLGGSSTGGPTTQTGTNNFVFLALDSIDWTIQGFLNEPSAGGGAAVQLFCNSQSAITSSPGVMSGCVNLGTWDKMIYQYIDGAVVVGNYSRNISTGGSKESIRVGGKCRVANNIVQGGVQILGPSTGLPLGPGGASVVDNHIWDYDHVGIQFGPIGILGAGPLSNVTCSGNTVIAATPGGAVTEVYEAIRFSTSAGVLLSNINIGPNTLINADMTTGGGASANLGAISIQSGGTMSNINIGPQTIISPGSHGIVVYDARSLTISGGTALNCGSDSSASIAYGVKLLTSAHGVRINGFKCTDDRGVGSRLGGSVLYYSSGGYDHDGNVVTNCESIGTAAGQPGINLGNPYASPYLTQIGGNKISTKPLVGTFTMANAASLVVSHDGLISSSSGTAMNYTNVRLTPMNVAAVSLIGGGHFLWVSDVTAKTSFKVQTYDGSTAAGTEVFQYEIVQ